MTTHEPSPGNPASPGFPSVDPAQESLSSALRAGFNILRLLMVVLLIAYFLSGWFQVQPGEQGVIVRFGKLLKNSKADSPHAGTAVFDPGLHVSLPDPFDQKIRIPGATFRLTIETFCFPRDAAARNRSLADAVQAKDTLAPGPDGYMIAGDRNIAHGVWAVEYRVEDAEAFVRTVGEQPGDAERLLRRLTEAAIVRTVSGLPIEDVTRTNVAGGAVDFTVAVRNRLNGTLAQLGTGLAVDKVTADTIEPGAVREAFLRVANARAERETQVNKARQEAERILSGAAGGHAVVVAGRPRKYYELLLDAINEYGAAQTAGASPERLAELRDKLDAQLSGAAGDVAGKLREAQSRADEVRERLRRELEQFTNYLAAYRKNPRLTVMRLWVRMRDTILSSKSNEVFYLPQSPTIEIITNRDPQRAVEADRERLRSRARQP